VRAVPEYADELLADAHRRGAGLNPGNRFEPTRFHLDGDYRDARSHDPDDLPARKIPLSVYEDRTRRIIHKVEATSDVPFDWTLNPYRGCEHGCVYCYARPWHEYLGFSAGLDFETKLIAKPEAPDLLRRELSSPRWQGEPIVMSAITDVYQPLEARLGLTRACLEIMAEANQPVSTMTKGSLVLRDLDLWQRLAQKRAGRVTVTLVTLDDTLAKSLEPRAASPARRLRMIRELADANVPVAVNVAPVIPGLTDHELPLILEAVADHGATTASWVLLRLPYQLKAIFLDWMRRALHPSRAARIESRLRQARNGRLYDAATRWNPQGSVAAQIGQAFEVFCRRYGLNAERQPLSSQSFHPPPPPSPPPRPGGQMSLF
jgi:DNA repair photolyase